MLFVPNSGSNLRNIHPQVKVFQNWQHFCSCFWRACANCGLSFLYMDCKKWQPVWSLSAVVVTHPLQGWRRLVQELVFSVLAHLAQETTEMAAYGNRSAVSEIFRNSPSDTNSTPLPFFTQSAAQLSMQHVILATSTR